jgi:hypothetical protein
MQLLRDQLPRFLQEKRLNQHNPLEKQKPPQHPCPAKKNPRR